jgi:hypothetical protein
MIETCNVPGMYVAIQAALPLQALAARQASLWVLVMWFRILYPYA